MTDIGIMQGRLLPQYENRFQAFPADGWQEEFHRARAAGLASIELIYEVPHEGDNPVGSDEGVAEIRRLSGETGVLVRSICADYYMDARLVVNGVVQAERVGHLNWLLGRAAKLGMYYIVIPFVDRSSLRTKEDHAALKRALKDVLPEAESKGVELHLETDLPPDAFARLLEDVNHPKLKANYDIGNSASLGFDPTQELTLLGPWLGSVHVKDRVLGGGTVPLGTGNADLPTCFRLIEKAGYRRPYIMQVARGREGDEVRWAQANREYIERQLAQLVR